MRVVGPALTMTTLGFLHTSPVHVATFDHLVHAHLPGVDTVHVVDEDLLAVARLDGPAAVGAAVRTRLLQLHAEGADVICCTCSTIGGVAEETVLAFHVFRVDRPMARQAVSTGRRIAVLAALESTLAPTRELILEEAVAVDAPVSLDLVPVPGAWSLFEAGEMQQYAVAVASAARSVAEASDVIVLAQASMAGAESLLADLGIPVLSSPRLAVEFMREVLGE